MTIHPLNPLKSQSVHFIVVHGGNKGLVIIAGPGDEYFFSRSNSGNFVYERDLRSLNSGACTCSAAKSPAQQAGLKKGDVITEITEKAEKYTACNS